MAVVMHPPAIVSPEIEPSIFLEGFIHHVQSLARESSYQYLKKILEENSNLKDRNHVLDITNEENYRTISKLQVQLDDYSKRYEEQIGEIATLAEEKASWDAKVAKLESDAESAQKTLNDNAEAISRLQTEVTNKSASLEAKDAELESTKTELTNVSATLDATTSDLEAVEVELDETKATLDSTMNDLERSKADVEKSRAAMQSADTELKSANTRLVETTTTLETTRKQLQESVEHCSSLQIDVNVKSSDLESLQVSLDEERSALAAAEVALEKATTNLRLTRDDLDKKNTRLGELDTLSFKMRSPPQVQT